MGRFILAAIGIVFILFGLLTVWTPIPTGIPSLLIGVALLMNVSSRAQNWVLQRSKPYPRVTKLLLHISRSQHAQDKR